MATATAAAGEVLQHMGPVPRVEETNNTAAAAEELGGDDEEILRFMDSADGYLLLMDSLSSALRQGWLDLASARHSMGASRVSSMLFDHKEQSAATKLQVVYPADLQPSESNPHFSLSKWCLQEESNSSDIVCAQDSATAKLRYRGSAATPDSSNESDATTAKSSTGVDVNSQVQKARSKALSVFGALVSPKLRTAQVSFETALELIVELANARSVILSSFSQIKHEA
ncbi:coiled-coil domain-containing protein 115-like [Triticum urartu]|uniref:coiled-coil domain-containing protein 115-like n=1 Tax=Triticum urartu TaxID=4572 RepID=UPI002043020F|nr:coiled-coil domain-containing protein 115-like [Triticum urartu]XP_048558296.1 coiled-coil domain-containing protein 115-like [Triticum urartu]